jgi:hypothetical protein
LAMGTVTPMMYLLIWTIFSQCSGMISLGIKPEDIPPIHGFL